MPKEKIVVISQDYDGCYDINTPEFVESQLDLQVKKFQKEGKLLKPELVKAWKDKYRDYYKKMTGAPRAALQKYYSEITRDADKVKVYVGSDRQSHYIDQLNETKKIMVVFFQL